MLAEQQKVNISVLTPSERVGICQAYHLLDNSDSSVRIANAFGGWQNAWSAIGILQSSLSRLGQRIDLCQKRVDALMQGND